MNTVRTIAVVAAVAFINSATRPGYEIPVMIALMVLGVLMATEKSS